MKIIHWGRARQFYRSRPGTDAEAGLKRWKNVVKDARWQTFGDVQRTMKSADWVDGYVIFNICHNHYRLVAIVRFELGRLYIQEILEHKEYDKEKWKR